MNRLAVITVGKTHSGKTTFANALEKRLANAIVVDQDNHAKILQSYYILEARNDRAGRDTDILRTVSSFKKVLGRQKLESLGNPGVTPATGEADYLFNVANAQDAEAAIVGITQLACWREGP